MAAPLLLLGLVTLGGVGTGVLQYKLATDAPDLKPRIYGFPATPVMAIGGLALATMGGSVLAPLGLGVLVGSLVGGANMAQVKSGLDQMIEQGVRGRLALPGPVGDPPAPPALPGPGAGQVMPEPGRAPGAGLLSWLLPAPGQ